MVAFWEYGDKSGVSISLVLGFTDRFVNEEVRV